MGFPLNGIKFNFEAKWVVVYSLDLKGCRKEFVRLPPLCPPLAIVFQAVGIIEVIVMISSLCWVPKGASKVVPVVADPPSKEEIEELLRTELSYRSGDADDDEDEVMDVDTEPVDDVAHAVAAAKALNEDRVGKSEGAAHSVAKGIEELNMDAYDDEDGDIELFGSGIGDSYYPSNDMDPYIQKRKDDDDEDEDEVEDMTIKPTDSVIVCARSNDVFEKGENTRDERLIEVQPFFGSRGVSKKKNKGKKLRILMSNTKRIKMNVLASASADKSVKIWDILLVNALLQLITIQTRVDAREVNKVMNKWSVMADVESLAWNPHVDYSFVVSQENGVVQGFDIRVASSDKVQLLASGSTDKMGSIFPWLFSEDCPTLLAIGGPKGKPTVWDITSEAEVAQCFERRARIKEKLPARFLKPELESNMEAYGFGFDKFETFNSSSQAPGPTIQAVAVDPALFN
ncbi:hypothetical protein HPP92_002789 [Vanilla planifolia]|uniref:Transducin/WD40 repeat-like superfamily protein n=1 Tax=Vanilla planifolia TaxID=51239 RepID=A0A835VKW7_VANPL|nr:hypothetical protein HPP92_002789 [Vanilla planifolia]